MIACLGKGQRWMVGKITLQKSNEYVRVRANYKETYSGRVVISVVIGFAFIFFSFGMWQEVSEMS